MAKLIYIIDVKDYRKLRVVFTKKKWQEKSIAHPELNNKKFLENIKKTLRGPDVIWEDQGDKEHKRCYYKKYSVRTYIKVVIWLSNPNQVVTAFEIDYIKESKYPGLKQLK